MQFPQNDITSASALRMINQIRCKQFATAESQNKLIKTIKLKSEECKDQSGTGLYKLIDEVLG